MSLTASRPPGFSTRAISRKTAGLSGARLITQLEITQSTEASGSGSLSMVARWNSTFVRPAFSAFLRARSIISGRHVDADRLAGRPDLPGRQEHVEAAAAAQVHDDSPARRLAVAVGLPQDRPMFASAGIEASSSGV